MNVPEDLRYTSDHEWARREDGGRLRIGITDYAQDALGDIVFVLVDLGYLISQPTDNRADFIGVYNFDRAFEHEYPWNAAALV